MKIFSFLYRNEKEVAQQQIPSELPSLAVEKLGAYYKIIILAHSFFIENNWPIKCTSKSSKVVPLVVDLIKNNNRQNKQRLKKYINRNSRCAKTLQPLFYRMDIFEKQILSNRLISLYQLLNMNTRDDIEITKQINAIIALMLRLMPNQYINMFASYFINNVNFTGINPVTYNKCMCMKMMLSAGCESEQFNLKLALSNSQNNSFLSDQYIINYCIKLSMQRSGKKNKNWIYDYI